MNKQFLREATTFTLHRQDRYLIAELSEEHLVLSTSVNAAANSRRCVISSITRAAKRHNTMERHDLVKGMGQEAYHDLVCGEIGLAGDEVALLGTAANMNYAAVVVREDRGLEVTAAVTAGVQGNACCAGDPASWRETENGLGKNRRHDQHATVDQSSADSRCDGAGRRHNDGGQDGRPAAAGCAQFIFG